MLEYRLPIHTFDLFDDCQPNQFKASHNRFLLLPVDVLMPADLNLCLHFLAAFKVAKSINVIVVSLHLPVLWMTFDVWLFDPKDLFGKIRLGFRRKYIRDKADEFDCHRDNFSD